MMTWTHEKKHWAKNLIWQQLQEWQWGLAANNVLKEDEEEGDDNGTNVGALCCENKLSLWRF